MTVSYLVLLAPKSQRQTPQNAAEVDDKADPSSYCSVIALHQIIT